MEIFFHFRKSYWYLLEQIRILKYGVGAIWKNHIVSTGPPTTAAAADKADNAPDNVKLVDMGSIIPDVSLAVGVVLVFS